MNRFLMSLVMFASAHGVCTQASATAALASTPPNIVVILADDMGWSDIGSYGGEIPTPHLDSLAENGLRFSNFYNSARCSPTRASLLTGLYPHQAGMGHLATQFVKKESKGTLGILHDRAVTMAEVLNDAGYFTAMTGKWHLGFERGITPWGEGFQRSLNLPRGAIYFPNQSMHKKDPKNFELHLNGKAIANDAEVLGQKDWYGTDLWTDFGIKFIKEAQQEDKPFFLYLAHVAPHFPVMAPQKDIEQFRGKYMEGWHKIRHDRYQRQIKMGLIDKSWALTEELPEVQHWDELPLEKQQRYDQLMAVYAAAVSRMDQSVGRLVHYLEQTDQLDNTLILFLSDNGSSAEGGPRARMGGKGPMGGPQSNLFIGMNWATVHNTPFTLFKHFTHEGGIATPLIAHWPNGIEKSLNGTIDSTPGHVVDVMATAVDLSKSTYPKTFNGHEILPMSGASLLPIFKGNEFKRAEPIFFEHEGNRAVRDGHWKVVSRNYQPWELYDMTADRTEMNNIANKYPERVKAMAVQYNEWAERSFVDSFFHEARNNWGSIAKQ
ncbi:arylsulfatase [Echinimonas agarilytica]|uniref:Arylsulfatase n=1 Tax=Echinimonas agarilytica TaxID=1215918 RepID=A0AA41W4P3_9GAMM|nr:arylsulfatase [Echinimonas agarilytica]MCM2678710.1 arylsulfatase [Echinimonas agarilytica]